MKELIDTFVQNTVFILSSYGPLAGVFLIILESIIPIMPLSVFITLNMVSYGGFIGFIISWISTVIGCCCSFFMFRYFFQKKAQKYVKKKNNEQLTLWMNSMSKINFSNLAVLIAIPFTPAFLINIAASLSKITFKKFLCAILIGKAIMIYFWGYVGTSLLESLTDITVLIKVSALLAIAYIVSKYISKKFNV